MIKLNCYHVGEAVEIKICVLVRFIYLIKKLQVMEHEWLELKKRSVFFFC